MTAAQERSLRPLIARVADGTALTEEEAVQAFDIMMSGEATPSQIGGFLMALRVRGETVEEITGGARIMRSKALEVDAPADAVDTCGTGGDASGTYNVSTAVAFVVAACGVPVAKHGNRALSSKSGSADVLSALGVNIELDAGLVSRAIREAGLGFMMAPRHHGAMRHVGPTRVELGTRTIFNLLGPLSNPAGARRQLIGVFSDRWVVPMAEVLGKLGAERAWVVHGSDGLDELTTTGPSVVAEWSGSEVRTFEVTPEDAGLSRAAAADLRGGDAEVNARALKAVLDGAKDAYRDIVLLNAAATLIVADKAADLKTGAAMAADAVDSGKARAVLDRLVAVTNS
ncbi:MAG: anthranilate phosphoribosyltransferase [Alphaproteobacteria bacterium]|nr:anthranilate phosphoribosyltransferase [Alphaproteobacteria bacterium]MDX5370020.1 anthranilate phosphoribosyltransferase [Alphaproteobacteria bacterium]MDX5464598.1 anthranilate phosphoribosyltransferase [Alphaproteobacteria bacterium]